MMTPVGHIHLYAHDTALIAVIIQNERTHQFFQQLNAIEHQQHHILQLAKTQLEQYFQGSRQYFEIPIEFIYGTVFQQKVWQQLCQIPYGQTLSYQQLAHQIDSPKAVRAVGSANSKNPLSIVVPCHRVIGKNGHLVGFAGGLDNKAQLLQLEQLYL